jgi:uncharacterized protein (TIRG00374 family)
LAPVPESRRAADVLRLILALGVLLPALLVAVFATTRVRASERSLLQAIVTWPSSVRDALTLAVQVVVVLLPVGILVAAAVCRRFVLAGRLLITAIAATAAGLLVSDLWLGRSHPSGWHQLLAGRDGMFVVTFPPVAWLTAVTAMITVAGPALARGWRLGLWWLTGSVAAVEVLVGGFLPVDAVVAGALGVSTGSLVLLGFGGPPSRPSGGQVAEALKECGVEPSVLTELPPGPEGPAAFRTVTRGGLVLSVRVYSADDRDRDRLSRLWRSLLVRNSQDDRAGLTAESAAEHEMLAMVTAGRAGARVPEPVVAYPVRRGPGPPGALVAWADVGGRRLDLSTEEQVRDAALADIWRSVSVLQHHRLAHRQLRSDHIVVDEAGRAWVSGFARSELGAGDRPLAGDVAELLASLAALVGVDRAVASAVTGVGAAGVAGAAAYLQPLALTGPTRVRIREVDRARSPTNSRGWNARGLRPGGRPDLLGELRAAVAKATGTTAAPLEQLGRFTWRRTLTLLGAFAVVYLVLPQLANAPAALRALRSADWWWVLAALPAIFVAQAFSTMLQLGAIPADLPFGPTYVVQFGGSFLNRVTPNNVGGMALNFRYLQRAGVDSGAATGSVGLQAVAGMAATLVLVAVFFARTGRSTTVHVHLHVHQWVLVLVAVVLAACALAGLTPPGRRFFHDKIWGFLRSAGTTIGEVAKRPRHVALTIVGALGGPLVQIVALGLCVHAVGGRLPFAQVGAVYLGAHFVASAAPVPGGLGALEAALVAGLSALGMPVGAAASAVLIYRLLTFWLTIPVGWFSLKVAQGRGYV